MCKQRFLIIECVCLLIFSYNSSKVSSCWANDPKSPKMSRYRYFYRIEFQDSLAGTWRGEDCCKQPCVTCSGLPRFVNISELRLIPSFSGAAAARSQSSRSQSYYKCSNHTSCHYRHQPGKLHIVNPDQSTSCLDQVHILCSSGQGVPTKENNRRHTYSVVLNLFVERTYFTKSLMSTKKQLNIIVNNKQRNWILFSYIYFRCKIL